MQNYKDEWPKVGADVNNLLRGKVQWLPFKNRQNPVYEAKVATSDGYYTLQKCSHAIDHQRH